MPSRWSLCASLALVAACGAGLSQLATQKPRVVSDPDRSARLAAGPVGLLGDGAAEQRRLQRLAEVDARLGNVADAVTATEELLAQARIDRAFAHAGEGDASAADRAFEDAAAFARALARQLDVPRLFMRAVDPAHVAPDEAAYFATAAPFDDDWSPPRRKALWDALAARPDARLRLERQWAYLDDAPDLALADLVRLGAPAADRIQARLADAAEAADLSAVRAASAALASVDRWDLHGRLAAAWLADVDAGRLGADAVAPRDVFGRALPFGAAARLERALAAHPGADSLALALAARFIEQDLVVDARDRVSVLAAPGHRGPVADTARQLLALAALRAGDVAAFEAWSRQAPGAVDSADVGHVIVFLGAAREAPAPLPALARGATRRAFADGRAGASDAWGDARAVALDADAPRPLRQRALALLRRHELVVLADVAEDCLDRRLATRACEDRAALVDAAYGDDEEDDDESDRDDARAARVRAIVSLSDHVVLPGVVYEVAWELDVPGLLELHAPLVAAEHTPAALSAGHVAARVLSEIARGDAVAANAAYAAGASLLPPGQRVGLRLALADLRDGVGPAEIIGAVTDLGDVYVRDGNAGDQADDAEALAQVDQQWPGTSRVRVFERGLGYWRIGRRDRAADELAPLARQLDGVEGAELAALVALGARLHHDSAQVRAQSDRAHELAPGAPGVRLVDLRLAEEAGDPAAIARAWRALLRVRPEDRGVLDDAVRAFARAHAGQDGARRVAALLDALPGSAAPPFLDAALADRVLTTGTDVADVLDVGYDGEAALRTGTRFQRIDAVARAVAIHARQRLQDEGDPDRVAEARAAAAWLDGTSVAGSDRELLAWLWFVAGDGPRALAAADRPAAPTRPGALGRRRDSDGPLPANATVRLLAPFRARLSDRLALAVHAVDAGAGDPAQVAHDLVALAPGDPALETVACAFYGRADRALEALPLCRAAYEATGEPDALVDFGWALGAVDDAVRARTTDLEAFVAAARRRVRFDAGGLWLHNFAVVEEKRGRTGAALELELEAWVRGFEPRQHYVRATVLGDRPWAARLQEAVQAPGTRAERHRRLALASMRTGEVSAARAHLGAASAWLGQGDASSETRHHVLVVGDLVALAETDVASGAIDAAGVRRLFEAMYLSARLPEYQAIATRWPRSTLARLMLAEGLAQGGRGDEALAALEALRSRFPDNLTIVADLHAQYVRGRRYSDASRLGAETARRHPGDPRPSTWKVPANGADGKPAEAPAWASTAASFDARRAAVTDAQLDALAPRRAASVDAAAEAFFPGEFTFSKDLVAQHGEGTRVGVVADPRADRCEGEACVLPLVAALGKSGYAPVWKAPVHLPAGDGYQALLTGPGAMMWVVTLPAGAHTFTFFAASSVTDFEAELPGFELIARSFRPLDRTVAAATAVALRQPLALDDGLTWRARRAVPPANGCPLGALLGEAPGDAARGALLLDALLVAPDAAARRALIACAAPASAVAAPAALVALLDEDARVHAWGAQATLAAPGRVRADAERGLLDGENVPLSSRTDDSLLPPFGAVEVFLALPPAEKARFAAAIAARSEPRWQRLALVLPGLAPDAALDRAHLRDAVAKGTPALAIPAVWALAESPAPADVDALRGRADALAGPFDERARALALGLAEALAQRLDPLDTPRFERLAVEAEKRAPGAAAGAHRSTARRLREYGKQHARGLARCAGDKPPARLAADDGTIELWVARRCAKARGATGVTDAALAKRPLAQLVPGRGWTFARVAQPALFAAGAHDLGVRTRGASDTDTPLLHRIVDRFAENLVGHVFAASSGLDLGQPIECASPGDDALYVCVAHVKDRDAVRAELTRHDPGEPSGVRAPLALATKGFFVPMALALVPVFVDLAGESWSGGGHSGESERLLVERARGVVTIAGHVLERALSVELREGAGSRAADEVYLFAGDRLWLFSDAQLAADLLAGPPARGTSLAESPRFAALTRPWKDAGALQAVTLGASAFLDEEVAFAVATSEDGVDFEVGGHASGRPADVAAVAQALPDGAASWFAFSVTPDVDSEEPFDLDVEASAERGVAPPLWLVRDVATLALGWYPEPGKPIWTRWVGAVGLDERVREALAARHVDVPAVGTFVEKDGLTWARRGDAVLVVGAPRALVEQAVAHAAPAAPAGARPRARQVALGHLDGGKAAAALLALAAHKRAGDESLMLYKIAALVVGSTRAVELAATQDDAGAYRLHARVALNVAAPGATETPMVDAWLASRSLRNSARLPREVGRGELGAPIGLDLEVADAAATAARAFPDSARVHVTVVDDTHLRVEVAPGPTLEAPTPAAPLDARARRAALAPSGRISADAPDVVKLARDIVPAGSSPAEAARRVVEWVQKNLRYEVTPESLDALTILARGRGDCTEYSVLTVSLLRAAGVPAELREGMALDGGEMVAHAWVAFHDGVGWREIDPTFGVTFVDAGHLETSVMDFVSLVSVGRLKVLAVHPK